jgi:hypothetical protein
VAFGDGKAAVLDDEYAMNTQTTTQWDGFHHFAHLASRIFYNGCTVRTYTSGTLALFRNNHADECKPYQQPQVRHPRVGTAWNSRQSNLA